MTGRDDIIRAEQFPQSAYLVVHLLGSAKGQQFLRIHTANKHDMSIVFPGQTRGIHIGRLCLNGMQRVYTGLDKAGNNPVNGAARMQQYL